MERNGISEWFGINTTLLGKCQSEAIQREFVATGCKRRFLGLVAERFPRRIVKYLNPATMVMVSGLARTASRGYTPAG
jgi:hypothetical protein